MAGSVLEGNNLLILVGIGIAALIIQVVIAGFLAFYTSRIVGELVGETVSGNEQCAGLKMTGAGLDTFESNTVKFASSGFLNLYLDKTKDSVAYLEFNVSDIEEAPLEMAVAVINENGELAFYQEGPSLSDGYRYFTFQRSEDKMSVQYHRVDTTLRNGDPDYDSLFKAAVMPRLRLKLAQVGKRVGSDCKETTVIVDASELVKRGFFTTPFAISSKLTPQIELSTTKAFVTNFDMTVSYSDLQAYGTPEQEIVFRYTVYKLPKDKMQGRPSDDRVGYFSSDFMQLGEYYAPGKNWPDQREDTLINPTVRLINRFRLPSRLDGTNTITYFIDPSVPEPFWQASKLGVSRWQPAFDGIASGFPAGSAPKIVAYAPNDIEFPKDFDNADIRYNSISWATGKPDRVFAVAKKVDDPRSGEVLKGNILFTLGRLELYLGRHVVYGGFAHSPALRHFYARQDRSVGAKLDGHEEADDSVWHLAANPSSAKSYSFLQEGILSVVLHEMGHNLGLRHNFRGSMSVSFEQSQNRTYIMENGMTASVMDYLAGNYISKETKDALKAAWVARGDNTDPYDAPVYNPVIGAYDKWAIKYGYMKLPEEENCEKDWCLTGLAKLQALAGEYDSKPFSFATDETRDNADPYNVRRDLTSDPIAWFLEQAKVVQEGYDQLYIRVQTEGMPWFDLYSPLATLMSAQRLAPYRLCYMIGGIVPRRKHGSDCVVDGRPTDCAKQSNEPISAADQDRALQGILAALQSQPPDWMQKDAVQPVDLYGILPVDLQVKFYEWKARVLVFLLGEEKVQKVHLNGQLLGDSNRIQGWLLASCSKALLGLDSGAADPKLGVQTALQNQGMNDIQVKYLKLLKELKSSATSSAVRAGVAAEVQRLSSTFSDVSTLLQGNGAPILEVAFLADATAALR